MDKFETILADLQNGNNADFRKAIKKLTKPQILDLIEYANKHGWAPYHVIIPQLRTFLQEK